MKDTENPSYADRPDPICPVCPECAAPVSQRSVRAPWPVRRRRLVQAAVLLVALGYVVWRNIEAWPVMPVPTVAASIPFSPEFPKHRYSHADIEMYATGERSDGQLIEDIHNEVLLDNYELGVTFVSPAGGAMTFRRYGWPIGVLIYRYDADYDDVYAKTNPSAGVGTSRNGWFGLTYIDRRIDALGRRETFLFSFHTLTGAPVVVIAAWGIGRFLRWLAIAAHFARKGGRRTRDRLACRGPVVCMVLGAVGVITASTVPRVDPGYVYPSNFALALSPTGTFTSDIAQFARTLRGEAALARVILDATASTTASPDECLAFGVRGDIGIEQSYKRGGWPMGLVHITTTEQQGFTATGAPAVSLKLRQSVVQAVVLWDGTRQRISYYNFSYARCSHIALGLMAMWIGTGMGVWLTGWWVRRRTARRIERGLCVQCGYDLSGLRRDEDDSTQT